MGSQPNNSSSQSPTSHSADEQDDQTIKLIFLSLIISVGIIGNSLVIVVVKAIRGMRSTTNYLLVNVAVADIFALVFTIVNSIIRRSLSSYHSLSKFAQNFLCKFIFTNTMTLVPFAATVLTLTLLAVERYRALVKPMTSSSRLTVDRIAYVITGIWSASFALVTPLFATIVYHPNVEGGAYYCNGNAEGGIIIYIYCFVTILLLVPFIVIAFCYSRIIYCMFIKKTVFNNPSERQATQQEIIEKRRLVWLLVALTSIFFVAFTPYGIFLIMKQREENNDVIKDLHYATQYLTILKFSLNPFIYGFASSSYRRGYVFLLRKIACRNITTVDTIELREMQI
ncbi:G-protein coupled receptor 54-like [Acropora muricata]|uniref:substance-K receptor-like n=1 Tax=Acropora millepora TaxID=45264 RepID=UPI001CF22828|nr:substance-K receptor-like [Acropora millepora]XP_029212658.2 substance-K receptor-like [Acropora millepora]XP_029212659.2 substance-K receptor-like [Acropora millepora]XP_029212660.2 substance-K receptor-like [Acropora millepora]